MKTELYVWDSITKEIVTVPHQSIMSDVDLAITKRMYVIDSKFSSAIDRYGSYLFSEENLLIGFWEPHNFSDFPVEFKTQLLLLGIE